MKILITGATGVVGNALIELCLEQQMEVNYLTTVKDKIVSKKNYQGFYWNPIQGEMDLECFQDVTAIVNLAGSSIAKRWTPNYKKQLLQSRIMSLRTLKKGLEQVDHSGVRTMVSASAIGIYPHSMSNYYVEEHKEVDASFLGHVVQQWEQEARTFEKFSFALSGIRIGLVLSDKGGFLPQMVRPIRLYMGTIFGSGEQWQSWIHVQDLARMFLFLIQKELSGTFNGVAPNPVSHTKLTKEVAKILGKKILLPRTPKFIMHLILGEMSYLLFASQRVSSRKIEELGFRFKHQNSQAALDDLLKPSHKSA